MFVVLGDDFVEAGGGEGAFNFLFNLPSTLISLLLYFRIIFGFAPPALPFAICKRDICHKMAFEIKPDLLAESLFNEFKI